MNNDLVRSVLMHKLAARRVRPGGGGGNRPPPLDPTNAADAKRLIDRGIAEANIAAQIAKGSPQPARSFAAKWGGRAAMGAGAIGTAAALLNNVKSIKDHFVKPKMFGPGSKGRQILGLAGLATVLGTGTALGAGGVDAIRDRVGKARGFKATLEENPEFKAPAVRKDAEKLYSTLHRFSPQMAADPLVAGSFLRRQLMFKSEGVQAMDVKTISEVNKLLREGDSKRKDPFGDALAPLGKAPGLDKLL